MCDDCEDILNEKKFIIERAAFMQSGVYYNFIDEINDVKQAAYERVIRAKINDPEMRNKPDAYFHSIVNNLTIDIARRETDRFYRTDNYEELSENHQNLITDCVSCNDQHSIERRRDLLKLLKKANPKDLEILFSIFTDEPIRDFAERHQISESNAKIKRKRAKENLRVIFREFADG